MNRHDRGYHVQFSVLQYLKIVLTYVTMQLFSVYVSKLIEPNADLKLKSASKGLTQDLMTLATLDYMESSLFQHSAQ